MLVGRKRTTSSFGPDGRRRTPSSLSCGGGGGLQTITRPNKSRLFSRGTKILVQRAPIMSGLSCSSSSSSGLQKKFRRPMTKRRAYNETAEQALASSSLGMRRRMDGMSKLMARAGRGLTYKLPSTALGNGNDNDENDSDDDSEEEEDDDDKENDRPFEPLCVWTSPHQGGEMKGLPPYMVKEVQPDEYGVEEEVTVMKPAPLSAYNTESVFVPPVLAKWLRPHQREGVQFLYECVMGLKNYKGNGCILADDMGLGKTLQSVTLIYTLLQTKITSSAKTGPTAKRVIVVCPCSLVKNWENEFVKWLGPGTVKTMALAEADRKTVEKNIDIFVRTKMFNVLVASYECIRTHIGRFTKYKDCCDLLVCDEAHRLKNRENQTSMALFSLPVKRRVLLTGTPMQNDLQEFFAMVDFTNPGVLGTQEEFRKQMLFPILRGREPDATPAQKQKMMTIQMEMSNIVNDFILRRVNTLNAQHLPPKLVQVVCCNLTDIQRNMYQHLVNSKDMHHVLNGKQVNCLGSIQMLMKLCNHPKLIVEHDSAQGGGANGGRSGRTAASKKIKYTDDLDDDRQSRGAAPGADGVSKFLPYDAAASSGGYGRRSSSVPQGPVHPEWSGKMFVLYRLMKEMRRPGNGNDKIVIVSNYTQTLDLIGKMCGENNWGFCRLDGSIGMKKRQKMVDDFNNPASSLIAFLLSSKAGGCGLNLIGGNRLVLFDPDWNPAVDKQAAARCWRDGQKKRCFTYRFLATGTVEEKIFQRQLSKEGLQSVVDDKEQVNALSTKDLRNLFKLRHGTPSDTHDKLKCERCQIIADNAEMEAIKVLPQKLKACRAVLDEMMAHPDAQPFLTPLNPTEYNNVSQQEYDKLVKQPIDLSTISKRLDIPVGSSGAYKNVSELSKDVNRIFSNIVKVWTPSSSSSSLDDDNNIADRARRLQSWWVDQWTSLVPKLMTMKASNINNDDADGDGDGETHQKEDSNNETNMECVASINNERGDDFQEQIGMPDEENMRHWSHHYDTDTVDDPVFRAAMRGCDSVSFVFGLEVTWSLIQQRQQEEEERQAMLELEELGKHNKDKNNANREKEEEFNNNMNNTRDTEDSTIETSTPGEEIVESEVSSSTSSTSNELGESSKGVVESNDDDHQDEVWSLSRVYTSSEIVQDGESCCSEKCDSENCAAVACSVWKSNSGEEFKCCFDCQDEEFGGWPESFEPPDIDHLAIIMSNCRSTKGQDLQKSTKITDSMDEEPLDQEEVLSVSSDIHETVKSTKKNQNNNFSSTDTDTDTDTAAESDDSASPSLSNSSQEEDATTMIVVDSANKTLDRTAMNNNKWSCYVCTFENNKSARKCKMCDTKRPPPQTGKKRSVDEVY